MDRSDVFGRPLVNRPNSGAWAVMAFAILWGYGAYDRNFNPEWTGLGWNPGSDVGANIRTYRYAARLARDGQSFYGVAPPGLGDWAVYLYPPVTVSVYYPFIALEWLTGYWVIVALNALAGVVAAAAIVRFIDRENRRLGWIDVVLIVGLLLVSPFTFGTIYYGNINLLVALAFVAGFLWLEDDRPALAGAAFGLAALFKLFPALVGAWLLRRGRWRSIASATAVGIGGLLAGVLLYGVEPTVTFFSEVVPNRAETANFVGGYPADGTFYVSVQRPLSNVLWGVYPNAPPELLMPLALVVAAGVLYVFYRNVTTLQERLISIFATMVVTVTLFPALQWYLVLLFFPMVPLWYVWEGPGRDLFLAGGAVMFVNERPGALVDAARDLGVPSVLEFLLVNVASFATVPLYGVATMLLACSMATYGLGIDGVIEKLRAASSRH
ncbi:glycosyltransferase 87 family protein [Halobellus sp. GM3]|uniref:glycosyltransferase 87 family protein n=1 Tax=Halobellus sp. GM3 TaxID=3458410 RepID=UPI00403DFBB4